MPDLEQGTRPVTTKVSVKRDVLRVVSEHETGGVGHLRVGGRGPIIPTEEHKHDQRSEVRHDTS